MTTGQLHLFNAVYLTVFVVVAVLTRATLRRAIGALAGGTAAGAVALVAIALGEYAGWWHMAIRWTPYFVMLLWLDFALSAFALLITWRIARHFGRRGLATAVILAAIVGPPRDYWYMSRFPEWGAYAPGVVPVVAISATYVVVLLVGHGVMRLVAGPSRSDNLARRPR